MKTQDASLPDRYRPAAVADPREPTPTLSTTSGDRAGRLQEAVDRSARMSTQRQAIRSSFGGQKTTHPNRTGMSDSLKAGIEAQSGLDMSAVRVHRDSDRPAQLNALAYAQGTEIHLGPGQERHLPHEAWHVVQQAQGRVAPTRQLKSGVDINDDTALEQEADIMGQRALALEPAAPANLRRPANAGIGGSPHQLLAKGGLEYTETSPLVRWNTAPHGGPPPTLTDGTHRAAVDMSVLGDQFAVYHVPMADAAALGATEASDETVWSRGRVRLTNDTQSPEWIISAHGGGGTSLQGMLFDINTLFAMRVALQSALAVSATPYPGETIVFTPAGNAPMGAGLTDPSLVFQYPLHAPSQGAAQITLKYKNKNTIKRIAEVNLSAHLKGGAIRDDLAHLRTTQDIGMVKALFASDAAPVAQQLRGSLAAQSKNISEGPIVRLTADDVSVIKMMILSDAVAVVLRRYTADFGQSDDKNMQRFFPKSRRQHYVHALAQAQLSNAVLGSLRTHLRITSTAMVTAFMSQMDLKTLNVTKVTQSLPLHAVAIAGLVGKVQSGTATAQDRQDLSDHIFGVGNGLLATAAGEAIDAYTELAAVGMVPGEERHVLAGNRGSVVSSMAFADAESDTDPGAIFELRNREVPMGEGQLDEITAALEQLFEAA